MSQWQDVETPEPFQTTISGEEFAKLKLSYRNGKYLAWLRKQKCFVCPTQGGLIYPDLNTVTASHILRGYHGLKNHDWASVPMCSNCHWLWEYHKERFDLISRRPTLTDAEKYFQKFLIEESREDDRTEVQRNPL